MTKNEQYRIKETRLGETEPLFCENCGITELQPMYGQRYCRWCGGEVTQKNAILERLNKLVEENERYEKAFNEAKDYIKNEQKIIGRKNGKSVNLGMLYGMQIIVDTIDKRYLKGDERDETNNGN